MIITINNFNSNVKKCLINRLTFAIKSRQGGSSPSQEKTVWGLFAWLFSLPSQLHDHIALIHSVSPTSTLYSHKALSRMLYTKVNPDFQSIYVEITKLPGGLGEEIQELVSTAVIQNLTEIQRE